MKQYISLKTAFFAAALIIMQSCSNTPDGDKAIVTEKQDALNAAGETFTIDTTESRIRFTGNGVGKNHPGNFRLSSGTVSIADNKVTGGSFIININSMEVEQKGDMFQNKLKPHLLSGDFFDAEKFGSAKFEITKVEPFNGNGSDSSVVAGANFNISGNFTLKETTKNITFPAKIDLDGDKLKAKGNFNIDRTQWKMNYGNDKTLGDKFISETVNIELNLEAKKQ